jgi:predicted enzyme related to lactoylglutathione lyase
LAAGLGPVGQGYPADEEPPVGGMASGSRAMTEVASFPPGTPSWCDLSTTDLAGALRFYSELFGWEVGETGGPETGGYTMFTLRDLPVAAAAPQMAQQAEQGVPPAWTTYISVEDVDEAASRVESLGGELLAPPFDVLDFGRMCVLTDPSGAPVALWQSRTHAGAGIVNEPGAMCWNELTTRDPEAAQAFFAELLGWEVDRKGPELADYREFRRAGEDVNVAGCMPMVGEMWPDWLPAHWMVYFAVDDVDAVAVRAAELGGSVSVPPTDIQPGRFAVLGDPQGAVFSVITMNPELAG